MHSIQDVDFKFPNLSIRGHSVCRTLILTLSQHGGGCLVSVIFIQDLPHLALSFRRTTAPMGKVIGIVKGGEAHDTNGPTSRPKKKKAAASSSPAKHFKSAVGGKPYPGTVGIHHVADTTAPNIECSQDDTQLLPLDFVLKYVEDKAHGLTDAEILALNDPDNNSWNSSHEDDDPIHVIFRYIGSCEPAQEGEPCSVCSSDMDIVQVPCGEVPQVSGHRVCGSCLYKHWVDSFKCPRCGLSVEANLKHALRK